MPTNEAKDTLASHIVPGTDMVDEQEEAIADSLPTLPEVPTRDNIRAKIFASKAPRTKVITFFGTEIELRQPTFGSILAAREEEDQKSAVLRTLINNAYLPKTDIKIFTPEDAAEILELPMCADIGRVSDALGELSEVNFPMPNGTLNNTQ